MIRKLFALLLVLVLLPAAAFADPLGVEDCVAVHGASAEIRYTLPALCKAALSVCDSEGNVLQTVFTERTLLAGLHVMNVDADFFALADGEYTLLLTTELGNAAAVLTLALAEETEETKTPPPASEPTIAPELPVITPAVRSAYHPNHENCYWCTNMDITDEEAVWGMLTAPITVVDVGQKEQIIVRAEPDSKSAGIGVVTGASQAVHVLERQGEWTLIEAHSSSFHDSRVKNYNAFITGYVPTRQLKTREVNQTYGMVLDKLTQKLYIFKEGKLFSTLLASTGLYNDGQPYNETRTGEFIIISRVGDFKSDNLVCSMALRFNSGDLLHEVPHTLNADGTKNYKNCEPKLGIRASHGCARIQRRKNAEGVNMAWLWNNIKVGTKLVIWEDWQGRQIPLPDPSTVVYYNTEGGTNYHAQQNCSGVRSRYWPLSAITYGELEAGDFASLTPCSYCTPEKRPEVIREINRVHMEMSPGEIMSFWKGKDKE